MSLQVSAKKHLRKKKRIQPYDPVRISVMITDPEGIEVGKDVFKARVSKHVRQILKTEIVICKRKRKNHSSNSF